MPRIPPWEKKKLNMAKKTKKRDKAQQQMDMQQLMESQDQETKSPDTKKPKVSGSSESPEASKPAASSSSVASNMQLDLNDPNPESSGNNQDNSKETSVINEVSLAAPSVSAKDTDTTKKVNDDLSLDDDNDLVCMLSDKANNNDDVPLSTFKPSLLPCSNFIEQLKGSIDNSLQSKFEKCLNFSCEKIQDDGFDYLKLAKVFNIFFKEKQLLSYKKANQAHKTYDHLSDHISKDNAPKLSDMLTICSIISVAYPGADVASIIEKLLIS